MTKLELPPTSRTAHADELPQQPEYESAIQASRTANIVESYTIQKSINETSYNYYSEVNIDNSRLWDFFKAWLLSFTQEVSLIFCYKDADPNFGKYVDKMDLLNTIEPYAMELCQDGFIEFGIIYNDDDYLKEVYVSSAKYLKIWGKNVNEFEKLLNDFSIYPIENLNFIDEFPMVTENLLSFNQDVRSTDELLKILKQAFLD